MHTAAALHAVDDANAPLDTEPIDALFRAMCELKASDLHLSVGSPPAVRKDGRMQTLKEGAAPLTPESLLSLLMPILPATNKKEFHDRHDTDFAYELAGTARFRGNAFMDRKGPGAVFRVIPSNILTAEQLGLSQHILNLCHLTKGLVLVTGPTGSGKSTTLCAMVDYINRNRADHIITIEDPIEFVHENKKCLINQREVRTHTTGSRTRCAPRCAKTRTSFSSARCATSRRSRSRSRPPKPATSCSARCTRRPPRRPSTASSISFRPIGRRRSA